MSSSPNLHVAILTSALAAINSKAKHDRKFEIPIIVTWHVIWSRTAHADVQMPNPGGSNGARSQGNPTKFPQETTFYVNPKSGSSQGPHHAKVVRHVSCFKDSAEAHRIYAGGNTTAKMN
jgi:hypothetical protein